jgi:hypothetical protein
MHAAEHTVIVNLLVDQVQRAIGLSLAKPTLCLLVKCLQVGLVPA